MIFSRADFEEALEESQTVYVLKKINEVLESHSKVLYGRLYANGDCLDFSTEKKQTDTHVCLGVELTEMGRHKPSNVPLSVGRPTERDLLRATLEKNRILEKKKTQQGEGK